MRSAQAVPLHRVPASKPAGGAQVQTPLVQSAPAGHFVPHTPQFLVSVFVFTHVGALFTIHIALAPVHPQMPLWQPTPASHSAGAVGVLQRPQLIGS